MSSEIKSVAKAKGDLLTEIKAAVNEPALYKTASDREAAARVRRFFMMNKHPLSAIQWPNGNYSVMVFDQDSWVFRAGAPASTWILAYAVPLGSNMIFQPDQKDGSMAKMPTSCVDRCLLCDCFVC